MFGKSIKIFSILGFDIRVDISWIFIAILVTWSLATGFFPAYYEGLSTATLWWMGIGGAVGLFVSIIFHELAHSIAARRYGIQMRGITLFIFGGVAQMDREPPTAKSEFIMAIAGPIASVLLGAILYGVQIAGSGFGLPESVVAVINYLAFINVILAVFNMVPAFPLDGGRVLRSLLWGWKDDLRYATRLSSRIGSGFGTFLIFLGVFSLLTGNFIGGLWWILIGMFLKHAARMSYEQLLLREALQGEAVQRFMRRDPVTVAPDLTLQSLVDDYVYRYHYKMYPIVDDDELVGCVTTRQLKEVPRDKWQQRQVREIAGGCTTENTISPQTDATQALSTMRKSGNSRLMVVENGKLVGVVALKDMLEFLSLKIDLEYNGR